MEEEQSYTLMAAALIGKLMNLFYLEPKTTELMFERHILERELKTGHEVGTLTPDNEEARNDPKLKAMNRRFGMLHGVSATIDLISMCCGGLHMYNFYCASM